MSWHTMECHFDYGFWAVAIESRYGMAHAIHGWLVIAIVQALWRHRKNKRLYAQPAPQPSDACKELCGICGRHYGRCQKLNGSNAAERDSSKEKG